MISAQPRTGRLSGILSLGLLAAAAAPQERLDGTNLVSNGSFEKVQPGKEAPEDWAAAGHRSVRQSLGLDAGRDGGRCARLECTEFSGDTPDAHAMICQRGHIAVRGGRWYRFRFWTRARDLKTGSVEVALVDTRTWSPAGLAEAFTPAAAWQPFEFRFQTRTDVPAASSRLQFWFRGTGTLWLDDVELIETEEGQEWLPPISAEGVKNLVPNASFECGTAGWGGFTWGLRGWAGNLFRLEGALDEGGAFHGRHSLRIRLTPETLPVFWFDYYEPIRQPVRRVLAANLGWFRVRPGEALTLSVFLRADAPGTTAQLAAVEAPARRHHRAVPVGTEWQRFSFTFRPAQPFVFIAVGLDLEATGREAATLWIDAVQLEPGASPTPFEPRHSVEAFLEMEAPGPTVQEPDRGLSFAVRAFNNTPDPRTVRGRLVLTDFFDRTVHESEPELRVPPHSEARRPLDGLVRGRRGFFRARWTAGESSNTIRCSILDPSPAGVFDSPFGFNHAYPWDFLVRLARQAGVLWWRDWSAKWQTVEPEPGRFDFHVADEQIHRIEELGGEVLVLLPFPSAGWSTTARPEDVAEAAGKDAYLRARLPTAWKPKNLGDFGRYAAETARRYRRGGPHPAIHVQILNEPLYTNYALPRQFGHTLEDYLRLLETAREAVKAAVPDGRVVAGIGAGPEAPLTREFIEQRGLRLADVLDLHIYDAPRPASLYEEPFRALEDRMRAHGGPRPVWITEWGCYADDDPPCLPHTVGDATMNRCRWPSERAAAEHIVKFAAVGFAHGVRKIFFHAGTCGTVNGPDAGGVLFEYGGAPRKMLPAVAAFTRRVGVPEAFVKAVVREGLRAYLFRSRDRITAVAWREDNRSTPLAPSGGTVRAYDLMGNLLGETEATVGESPLFLESADAEGIVKTLTQAP